MQQARSRVFLSGLVFLLLFLAGTMQLKTQAVSIAERKEAVAKKEQEVLAVQNFMNAHLDVPAYEKKLQQRSQLVERQLPDVLDAGQVVLLLQREAVSKALVLTAIRPGKLQEQGQVSVFPVDISFTCNYFQLLDFLAALEEGEMFLQIADTKIQSVDGMLQCNVQVLFYAEHAW